MQFATFVMIGGEPFLKWAAIVLWGSKQGDASMLMLMELAKEIGGLVFMTQIRVLQFSIGFMVLHLCLQMQLLVIMHSCAQNLEPMLRHARCMCLFVNAFFAPLT
jgi:hypothetical protein